jgi:uncharacterized protein
MVPIYFTPITMEKLSNYLHILWRSILSLVLVFFLSLNITAPVFATGVYEMPNVSAGVPTWVIDRAQVMSRLTKTSISDSLDKLYKETGKEVRFVTIHRLDYGETTQTFTDKLFSKWFPTPESQENQVLITLDNVTNTTGIVTGSGLKDILSDGTANSIAQETMIVPLRDGNKYNQSFSDAVDRLSLILSGKEDPGPPVVKTISAVDRTYKTAEETESGRSNYTIIVIGLLIAATVIPMVTYYWYQNQS